MSETIRPELLVSVLGYDSGRSCAVVSLAGRGTPGQDSRPHQAGQQ